MTSQNTGSESAVTDRAKYKLAWIIFSVCVLSIWLSFSSSEKFASKATSPSPVSANSFAISNELPLKFQGGKQVVLPLRTDQWSRQVVLPVHPTKFVDYRIEVEPATGYGVQFQDGHVEWVRADQKGYGDHGVRRGIFRIVGTSAGQKATVTISFRSPN